MCVCVVWVCVCVCGCGCVWVWVCVHICVSDIIHHTSSIYFGSHRYACNLRCFFIEWALALHKVQTQNEEIKQDTWLMTDTWLMSCTEWANSFNFRCAVPPQNLCSSWSNVSTWNVEQLYLAWILPTMKSSHSTWAHVFSYSNSSLSENMVDCYRYVNCCYR